jgi:TnpA family transposase
LKWVARHYIRPEALIAANVRIVDYHSTLWLAELWGGGEIASIDGLRFVVPNRTFHARFNRRYFHRRRVVTALGTPADHYAGIHTIVVPGTQPDWLHATQPSR